MQTVDVQVNNIESKGNDLLVSWSEDMVSALFKEIYALGFQDEIMAAEFDAVAAEKDPAIKEALVQNYRKKYYGIALNALRNLALRANAPEATKIIDQMQDGVLNLANAPALPLPRDIALIYRDLDQIPNIALSPCMAGSTRIMCALAPFFGKECKYTKVRDVSSSIHSGTRWDPEPISGNYSYSIFESGYHEIGQELRIFNRDISRHAEGEARFTWPLGGNDHSMCIENGNVEADHIRISADAIGSSADVSWELFLRGANGFRKLGDSGNCQASVHADSANPSPYYSSQPLHLACHFRGLNDLYQRTISTQRYPYVAGDVDTTNAAQVEVVSRIEFNASASHPRQVAAGIGVHLRQMGVLVLRDRPCSNWVACI